MAGNHEMHRQCGDTEGESESSQHEDPNADVVQLTEDISPSEALAASGLSALRYIIEGEQVGSVVACDNYEVAIKACERDNRLNGQAELCFTMLSHEKELIVAFDRV